MSSQYATIVPKATTNKPIPVDANAPLIPFKESFAVAPITLNEVPVVTLAAACASVAITFPVVATVCCALTATSASLLTVNMPNLTAVSLITAPSCLNESCASPSDCKP